MRCGAVQPDRRAGPRRHAGASVVRHWFLPAAAGGPGRPHPRRPLPPVHTLRKVASMARLPVALFNYENGGLTADGSYDFGPLQHAFADVYEPPALILFCEAKGYGERANLGLHAAAHALSDELGHAY